MKVLNANAILLSGRVSDRRIRQKSGNFFEISARLRTFDLLSSRKYDRISVDARFSG